MSQLNHPNAQVSDQSDQNTGRHPRQQQGHTQGKDEFGFNSRVLFLLDLLGTGLWIRIQLLLIRIQLFFYADTDPASKTL